MADDQHDEKKINPTWKELVHRKLDNELTDAQEKELNEYLKSSDDAQAELTAMRQIKSISQNYFAMLKNEAPADSIWQNVARKIGFSGVPTMPIPNTANDPIPLIDRPAEKVYVPLFKRRWISWSSAIAATIIGIISFYLFTFTANHNTIARNSCIVESVESKEGSVMVFKDKSSDTTYIWLLSIDSDEQTNKEKNRGNTT